MLSVMLLRLLLFGVYSRTTSDRGQPKWRRLFALTSLLTGCGWGYAAMHYLPLIGPELQHILTFLIVVYMSGALTTQFPVPLAFILMFFPAILPLIYRLFQPGEALLTMLGIMVILFVGFGVGTVRRLYRLLINTLELRFDNEALADHLRTEKRETEFLNQSLQAEMKSREQTEISMIEAKQDAETANQAKS